MEGMPTLSTGGVIAVTTVIHMLRSTRRRREFVYYCGVIGLCTPCTRAPSHTGRDPCWRGGLLALGFSSSLALNMIKVAQRDLWIYSATVVHI